MTNSSSGGSAAAGGMEYQHRVAAWSAVRILAERAADTPWDLGSNAVFESLRCETENPVDDLLIAVSPQGFVFSQIKHTLQLSEDIESELASTLNQFVLQFVGSKRSPSEILPLDRGRDRLILITSSNSSKPIRVHLQKVLDRARDLSAGRSLQKAALNQEEQRALWIVRNHIARLWKKHVGKKPSEVELRELLALIRIDTLDVDRGNAEEREAKNLLRTAILEDPDQADAVWARLINLCSVLAGERSGIDRLGLQQRLIKDGFELKASQSYQRDIQRLREYSETNVESVAQHSRIRVGTTQIKIDRPCTETLKLETEKSSLIVVGEPGAGKSGALHDVLEGLQRSKRDYLFLPVDRLASQSLGELRGEIGLEHELINSLENWPGIKPAFLVIDALDAARGELAAKMIHDLIRTVIAKGSRWHVIASIRKFDLRYSTELPQLFAGAPPTDFYDEEFRNVHHLNISRLSDSELEQVASQSTELQMLVNLAPEELHDLIRVPFNLRLLAELLGFGISPRQLVPIRTQIDLLERYWMQRVIREDGLGDAREATLRKVTENMVRARELRANRLDVVEMGNGSYLDDLLSAQVLVEWKPTSEASPDRYVLAFSHHVLFDYAVSRLLLHGNPERIVKWFEADLELVIVVRPSILFQFQRLWALDPQHKEFWNLVFRFMGSSVIPLIGKLIGPSVAASLAKTSQDLEILEAALEATETEKLAEAEHVFQHLVGALLVEAESGKSLAAPDAGPWCEFLERVSRNLRPTLAYAIRSLLFKICEVPEALSDAQRNYAGQAAQRLSEFAWHQSRRDSSLVISGLQCVCKTYESDPLVSEQLIRRCLEPAHLSEYGFEELPQLAGEMKRLIDVDPALVGDFYRATFANIETSDERTSIGGSRIMPLSSTRRQDYKMAFYELGNMFPQFLEGADEDATRTLIAVIASYVMQKHSLKSETLVENTFDVNGIQGRLCTDYSSIWDGSGHHTDDEIKMLNDFQRYLEATAVRTEDSEKLNKLIRIVIRENRFGVFWRRLLLLGAQFPDTMGKEIIPLAWTLPILIDYDTSVPAGLFIRAIFPLLGPNEQERIELAILSIPNTALPDQLESFEHKRDRLLGNLMNFELTTSGAQNMLRDLKAKDAVPPNELPINDFGALGFRAYDEKEHWARRGVPVDTDSFRMINAIVEQVKQFSTKHQNAVPSQDEFEDIIPVIKRLHEALVNADQDDVHQTQQDYGWGYLLAACNRLVRVEDWNCEDEVGELIRELLLRASQHSNPLPNPEHDGQFDEFPSWGSPSPRIEAAEGLINIARKNICANLEVLSAIHRLVTDPVPAVRYQIATRLNTLYKTKQQTSMWQIIEQICEREVSRGVLHGLLNGPLNRLAGVDPDRVAGLTKIIFDRVQTGKGAESVRDSCMSIFVGLYIWRDTKLCAEIAMEVASSPSLNLKEAGKLLSYLREPLTHGPIDPSEPDEDAVRKRAISLLSKLLLSVRKEIRQIEESYSGSFDDWSSEDIEHAQSLGQLIDRAGTEIYFASGAYNNQRQGNDRENLLTRPQMDRFYNETSAILDELATSGFASVTYHLIETLEAFIPLDPRGVFLRIRSVIRAGKDGGYQYEGLAANLMVKILERYLAEYRVLLQEDSECRRSLIEILDTFVQAGWPSARRLTYKLDEIFR